jgi:hypothetical protein
MLSIVEAALVFRGKEIDACVWCLPRNWLIDRKKEAGALN